MKFTKKGGRAIIKIRQGSEEPIYAYADRTPAVKYWDGDWMKTILVVEDDGYIGDMVEELLVREGYRVVRAYSGTEALLVLDRKRADLVLLDLMLPGLSGEEILPALRGIPVIALSAKADTEDKVNVLSGGANDYLTKPFAPKELLARIAVQFRNTPVKNSDALICFDDLTLNPILHEVSAQGKNGKLTRTESAIFRLLLQNPGQVITKSAILDRICEDTPDCTESSLKVHISNLRKKLAELCGKDYIESVWGIGFRLRTLKS